jgi:putative phage-type endonuclease
MDVFLDKRGEDIKTGNEEAMYWGSVLEEVVANEYQKRTERKVQRVNQMLAHPEHDFMLANIDRAIIAPEIAGNVRWRDGRLTTNRILECKTANGFAFDQWGDAGSDDVPDAYLLQCQWYLCVTRAEVADLAVLIGGSDYRIYSIVRDDALIDDMTEAADRFWKRVQEGIAPDPQSVAESARKWPRHIAGKSLIVDVTTAEACAELSKIGAEKKALESKEDELKTQVMKAFGDAEEISHMGRRLATWKTQQANRLDTRRLKEELPDIAEKFTHVTWSRVFRLAKSE